MSDNLRKASLDQVMRGWCPRDLETPSHSSLLSKTRRMSRSHEGALNGREIAKWDGCSTPVQKFSVVPNDLPQRRFYSRLLFGDRNLFAFQFETTSHIGVVSCLIDSARESRAKE